MSTARARILRKNTTDAEQKLWSKIRKRQMDGFKFRRQCPLGPYVVDFACYEKKLVVELDGGQHAYREMEDAKRTESLLAIGFRVLRFWNHQVFESLDAVLQDIFAALTSTPHPSPPPQGGREHGRNDRGK